MALFFLASTLFLLAPEGNSGPGGPTGGSGGDTGSGQTGAGAASPFAVFPTQEDLDARLARASKSGQAAILKQLGVKDEAEAAALLARAKELEAAELKRKQEQMSETERLTSEKTQAEQRAAQLAEQLEAERLNRHIASECARRGIASVDYATFLIDRESARLPDGQQLDVAEFLDKQLQDAKVKVALGIPEAPVTQVPDPPTTVPTGGNPSPPPPPAGGTGPTQTNAFQLSSEDWSKRKQELGLV